MGCRTGVFCGVSVGGVAETLVEFLRGCTVVGQVDVATKSCPGTHSPTVPAGGVQPSHPAL